MVKSRKSGDRLASKLGASIAAHRKARSWSQEELAERLGVSSETISRFERGATLPSLVTLHALGQLLRTPVARLLAESSPTADDQAAVISHWLSALGDADRDFVLALTKMACDFLRRGQR